MIAPWFLPAAEAVRIYAEQMRRILVMEALAKAAGRKLRP